MKICFVSMLTLDTDLHKTRELEIAKALVKRGHAVTLMGMISTRRFQLSKSRVNLISIPIRYVPVISPIIWIIFLFLFLPIYVLIREPDFIVMAPDASVVGSVPASLFSRFIGVKFVLDTRSTPVEVIGFRMHLSEIMFTIAFLVAKLLFSGLAAVTSSMKAEVCTKFDLDQNRAAVWTNGVDIDLFNPKKCQSESIKLKEQLNLTKKFVVFYHGAFSPSRGLTEAVESMQIVAQHCPSVVLFLLGKGTTVSILKELTRKNSLQNNVILHDVVPYEEVPKFIGLADVCIVPLPDNYYWRFQNALNLLEYLAMEKVVLATDIVANRAIVDDEKCCIYLKSVKPKDIAESIETAYFNKGKLDCWGKSGRKIIQKNYTWEKVAENVEHYLLSIEMSKRRKKCSSGS